MGTVTITKAKVAAPVAAKPAAKTKQPTALQKKVDRLIEVSKMVEDFKPIVKEYNDLRKELLEQAEPEYAATEAIVMTGTIGIIKFGPKAEERKIVDMKAIHNMLGEKTFYSLVSMRLGDADKYLTPPQLDKVIVKGQTGSRTFSFGPLPE